LEKNLTPFLNHAEILIRLGLNNTEAKIFLALCTAGTSTARTIAENSGVAREVVYQVMPTLQEKGIIEIVMTSPQAYKAISAEDAYEILLKRSSEENKKLKKEALKSLKALKRTLRSPLEECPQITIVPQGKANVLRILSELRNAKLSVEIIISWPKLLRWHTLYGKEEFNNALKRNVKFRVLTEKKSAGTKKSLLDALLVNTSFFERVDFRFAENDSLANMLIFDGKRAIIDVTADNTLLEKPSLFSNNPCVTRIALSYFEQNWEKYSGSPEDNGKNTSPLRTEASSKPLREEVI
jgi:sugar-specific transcriptional regulator TrmB